MLGLGSGARRPCRSGRCAGRGGAPAARPELLQVDDGRAGEILHPERVEPTAGVPDPVRDDRVDDGERGAEHEVDPELGPLGHGAPNDRDGHACEDDLEEIGAGAGD